MTKSVAIGVLLFIAGIIVGRVSVLSTQPSAAAPTSAPSPSFPNEPLLAVPTAPSGPSEAAPGGVLRGRVAEVIQVSQYTYLRLESGEWAAVPSAPSLAAGQTVGVSLQTEMKQFVSPSLGRTFEKIWFGALEGAEPVARSDERAPVAAVRPAPAPEVKAALKAVESSGALTLRVVDVYSERALLAGKRVKVKGTVDRTSFVQGMHYVHLKDGTGAAAEKTDDLLCLSSVEVPQGAAVTMEGVIAVDKNVGMGVNPVVLEEAQAH